MDQHALKKYVEDNPRLIGMKPTSYPGLFVLKYKKRVFFDNLWNRFTEECRGTIVDKDFNIISRPFTKIYNYGIESNAPKLKPDTPVTAYRKVNGFMVAMTWYNNDILVSTTGSTDSPYVAMAKEIMLTHQPWDGWAKEVKDLKDHTLMFECVHPDDPHIVPENTGLYFLGLRKNTWDSKIWAYGEGAAGWMKSLALGFLKCGYAEYLHTTVGELVALSKTVKHEGFVFYTADDQSSKIKSPHYLVSKFVARIPRTDKLMREDVKQSIDEEYYDLIDHIQSDIEKFTSLTEQERLAFVREFLSK